MKRSRAAVWSVLAIAATAAVAHGQSAGDESAAPTSQPLAVQQKNLLANAKVVRNVGTSFAQRLTDGIAVPEGDFWGRECRCRVPVAP